MARNGSGTYSKVNTFVAGNAITAAGHNQNWDDLVTEMTNSVAADGQTTITAQLKGFAGAVTAPGYSFSSDLNTGIYRIGADNLGVSVGGTKIVDVASTGITVTGGITSSATATIPTLTVSSAMSVPTLTLTGTLRASDGTVTDPIYTFTNDLDSGLYRIGANNFGFACNGAKVLDIATTGLAVTGALSATTSLTAASLAGTAVATQSDQETGTSTTTAVSPGRQQYHPSAGKFWLKAAGAGTLTDSYNITSVTDTGTGVLTVTIATDFSNATYCITTGYASASVIIVVSAQAAGSFALSSFLIADGSAADPTTYYAAGFGDQA